MHVEVVAAIAEQSDVLAHDRRLLEHLGRSRQVLRQRRFEPFEGERLAHDLDPAAVADQLDALHARLYGRDRDGAEGAVLVLDQRGRRVFGLHRLRAPPRQAPDRRRGPGEVTEQIECVGRLVHQHTAALARPRPAPVGGAVVAVRPIERVDDRDAYELPEPTACDQRARGGDHRPEALLEADTEQPPGPVRSVDHRVGLACLDSERLLDENMGARLERLDRERRVGRMRRADDNDIRRQSEQFAVVDERRAPGLLRASYRELPVVGADPDELDIVERGDRLQVEGRDHPGPDHAVAQPHAASSTWACAAIDRSAATQSRVASSPLPSRW